MLELYEWPPTRSQRAKWMLEELSIDYVSHKVNMHKGEQNTKEYKTVHPLGFVPAIKTDHYTMIESVAIVLQLIDEHPNRNLAPLPGTPERAAYYQWCVFAAAELDSPLMMYFDNTMRPIEHLRAPAIKHDPELAERGRFDFDLRAEVLSSTLWERDYLLPSGFSGADILIGHSCFMATVMDLINDYPVLKAYH
jgi:glutathione S-transferase